MAGASSRVARVEGCLHGVTEWRSPKPRTEARTWLGCPTGRADAATEGGEATRSTGALASRAARTAPAAQVRAGPVTRFSLVREECRVPCHTRWARRVVQANGRSAPHGLQPRSTEASARSTARRKPKEETP